MESERKSNSNNNSENEFFIYFSFPSTRVGLFLNNGIIYVLSYDEMLFLCVRRYLEPEDGDVPAADGPHQGDDGCVEVSHAIYTLDQEICFFLHTSMHVCCIFAAFLTEWWCSGFFVNLMQFCFR